MNIEVRTQAQLDKALKNPDRYDAIVIHGNGNFVTWGTSSPRIETWETSSPTIVTRETSSPRIETWGTSSPRIVTRETSSPTIETWETSSPRINQHAQSNARVFVGKYATAVIGGNWEGQVPKGAVLLKTPKITTAAEWCDYYGVTVRRGMAILFKALDDDYSTSKARRVSIFYTPGSKPKAPYWDGGKAECGGGLHFSPHPMLARSFNEGATRYVACPVKLSEIVVHKDAQHPSKVKAPRVCGRVYEVDEWGERV